MKLTLTKKVIDGVAHAVKKGVRFSKENSNFILTALAVLGVTITAEELVRATIKAVKICEEKQARGGKNVLKTVWKIYIPAAGFFLITTVAILGNGYSNAKKLATVTGLYALNRTELHDLKDKVKEVVGPKKEESIEHEVAKEQLERASIPQTGDIIETGHGHQLYQEYLSGRFIRTNEDYIELVQERLNKRMGGSIDCEASVRSYLDDFEIKDDCAIAESYWNGEDMQMFGNKEVRLVTTYGGRKLVNGESEMFAIIKPDPLPGGLPF